MCSTPLSSPLFLGLSVLNFKKTNDHFVETTFTTSVLNLKFWLTNKFLKYLMISIVFTVIKYVTVNPVFRLYNRLG